MAATAAATATKAAPRAPAPAKPSQPAAKAPAKASGTAGAAAGSSAGALYIIRLRGTQNLNPKAKDTLHYMRLNRVNHAVVLPQNETTKGMLQVAKDYVTWGEVDAKTLAEVLRAHGRIEGNKPLTEAHLAAQTSYKTFGELAAAIVAGKVQYKDVPGVKPLFRLHPARKGLEGIKRSVQNGGALGYRGTGINELVGRMIAPREAA